MKACVSANMQMHTSNSYQFVMIFYFWCIIYVQLIGGDSRENCTMMHHGSPTISYRVRQIWWCEAPEGFLLSLIFVTWAWSTWTWQSWWPVNEWPRETLVCWLPSSMRRMFAAWSLAPRRPVGQIAVDVYFLMFTSSAAVRCIGLDMLILGEGKKQNSNVRRQHNIFWYAKWSKSMVVNRILSLWQIAFCQYLNIPYQVCKWICGRGARLFLCPGLRSFLVNCGEVDLAVDDEQHDHGLSQVSGGAWTDQSGTGLLYLNVFDLRWFP